MKAAQFSRTGDLAALQLVDLPNPSPQPGEVVVEVHAAGVHPSDVKNVLGAFGQTTVPRVPGRDFAGVVIDGPDSCRGRAVWGSGGELGYTRDGSHAERIRVPLDGVALLPARLSFDRAASCGVSLVTAWLALERARLGAGDRLLVIGAAGAVGSAAVRLGRWRGAQVLAAVRRSAQARELAHQGQQALLLEAGGSLKNALREQWPYAADVVVDTTGQWLPEAVPALARGGRIAMVAAPEDGCALLPLRDMYRRDASVLGINSLLCDSRTCARILARIGIAIDAGLLQPPPSARVWPLERAADAYAAVRDGTAGSSRVLIPVPEDD